MFRAFSANALVGFVMKMYIMLILKIFANAPVGMLVNTRSIYKIRPVISTVLILKEQKAVLLEKHFT